MMPLGHNELKLWGSNKVYSKYFSKYIKANRALKLLIFSFQNQDRDDQNESNRDTSGWDKVVICVVDIHQGDISVHFKHTLCKSYADRVLNNLST